MTPPAVGTLAVSGGTPVRSSLLAYGRQSISDDDIQAVVDVLRSPWLTTGPSVEEFEKAFAAVVGAKHAVAVSNGTAALHVAADALRIGPGDEVIVPAITFAASANCVVYQGAKPVFADVHPETLLLDPKSVVERITARTKAIVAVDYAGQPCDYDALWEIGARRGLVMIGDAAHALGADYQGRRVGSLTDMTTFSFHPVKQITTGEGGMVTTDDDILAARARVFRTHGITTDHRQREAQGVFFYEMVDLGFNYRLTDFQCALGLSQLARLDGFVARRRQIAAEYDRAFAGMTAVTPLVQASDRRNSYHLYVIQLDLEQLTASRNEVFAALRAENIGVNVHYIPVHLHPFYRRNFATGPGDCPVAEHVYDRIITLPLFPAMSDGDVADVVTAVDKVVGHFRR
ncbi:MAG TPA: UDP-4-amino-4,6-dideoxy-N-acetyl-beta-L-altrosamine transaminase [Vicinamibacterales bacterium]|nr:UDP-4-amino-4,6-dideoxy-N-acetyl-beta-L-altrosamine transaminase [Vicinamibacterales bacterium]